MSADPHLLPDGSTSWGPDPGEPSALTAMPVAYGRVLAGSVPEPTEAMVQVVARTYGFGGPPHLRERRREQAKETLMAAIAAAPPEWLLRVALGEEELERLLVAVNITFASTQPAPSTAVRDLLIRALRSGEDMLREDAANVTRQVSGRRPRGLRGGEENDG